MEDVEETLRFGKVMEVDGVQVDMVITAGEGYTPNDASLNGLVSQAELGLDEEHPVGAINLEVGTKANLQVAFFEAGTTIPKVVPKLFFTVFDLERPTTTEEEHLKISGYDAVYLTKNTALMYKQDLDGTAFMPSDEAAGRAIRDPTDGELLSQEQRAHTATFLFHGTSGFPLSFEVTAPPGASGGRRLLFGSAAHAPSYAARISISYVVDDARPGWQGRHDWLRDLGAGEDRDDVDGGGGSGGGAAAFREPGPLETTCSCNLDLTTVKINNLGGLGPDTDSGHMIRYGDVCTVNGRKVDLVVEDVGGYASTTPDANGVSTCGPYGSISVRFGTMVSLQARFLDAETNAATRVSDFFFTVFDMDLHGAHAEKVTIHGFEEHFASRDTEVTREEVMNGGVFTSPGVLSGVQCPLDPLALTDQQASVGVSALFRDVGEFSFALEVMGAETQGSHSFLFGGTSSLNTDCKGHGLPTTTQTATTSTETSSTSNMSTRTTSTQTATATSTTTTTFNCSAHDPLTPWPEDARDFCCHLHDRFCATTTVGTATSTTQTRTTTSTHEPFNCTGDSLGEWPKNQSAWCCKHHHVGCPTTTTTRPEPFNCSDLEPAEWSTEKRAWCCNEHDKGCSLPGQHNGTNRTAASSTTPAPYAGCGEAVTCELRLDSVIHDNLGGMGPDRIEPNVLRYGSVCFTDDGPIDLVISVEGSYDPFNFLDNGKSAWGPYGAINVKLGTTVNLRATFVKAGTDAPAVMTSVMFSVFGLYQDSSAHQETLTIHSFDSFQLAADTDVHYESTADGAMFKSTDLGNTLDVAGDPLHCSEKQERTSVSFVFRQASSFAFSLAVAGRPSDGGRNFLFGGRSCITEHCAGGARTSGATSEDRYDCLHGDKDMWPSAQKEWCCSQKSIACGTPYDCQAGFASWRLGWSQVKMEWCCKHKKRGCQFNCDVAYNNWKAAWSEGKKQWCCNHEQRACGTPTSRSATPEQYDCDATAAAWTREKRKWCCTKQKKGCAATGGWNPFDCEAGADSWQSTWSHPKKQWCCTNHGRGCEGTTQEPFDCTDGFEHWKTRWAPPKLEWCCHNYNRGCANVMRRFEKLPQLGGRLGASPTAVWALGIVAALGVSLLLLTTGRQYRLSPLVQYVLPAFGEQAYMRLTRDQADLVSGQRAIRRIQRLEVDEAPP